MLLNSKMYNFARKKNRLLQNHYIVIYRDNAP